MKSLPIGIANFSKLRDVGCYYVDKTSLIREIISNPGIEVFLFTRPRRFGKTLNLSMIDAFFNIDHKGNAWFDGLAVDGCEECRLEKNRYPVIWLSFKDLDVGSEDGFDRSIRCMFSNLYDTHSYLGRSDRLSESMKYNYDSVLRGDRDPRSALKDLIEMLAVHHGSEAIVLIDEYDAPIQRSYGTPVQTHIIDLMRTMMSSALKDSRSLKFAVLTGVMQIAKESIFSGLNNVYVNSILSCRFDECFGFTEDEVRAILDHYGHSEKFAQCREWYDGYRFGNEDIYNPWSILEYVFEGCNAKAYWAGTSGNDIVCHLLEDADSDMMADLVKLGSGGMVVSDLDDRVAYSGLESTKEVLYSVMAMTGYLKAVRLEDGYELSIPNREMYGVFLNALNFGGDGMTKLKIRALVRSMKTCDTDAISSSLSDLMTNVMSARILDHEHSYQTFLIGLMMAFCGEYRIFGDTLETGSGFADIIFERRRPSDVSMIVEMKRSTRRDDLDADAASAMKQIHDRRYYHGMDGKVILYGMSFFNKDVRTVTETIQR